MGVILMILEIQKIIIIVVVIIIITLAVIIEIIIGQGRDLQVL